MNLGRETEEVEFKKSTGELKEGLVSLASMLNKNGRGTVYFGVRNDGEVIGQQIGDRTLREISQGVAVAIKPQIIPSITMELMADQNVIRVTARGLEKPYSAYGRYYMRSADEDREISPAQLRNLMLSTTDSIVNIESVNQELTFDQLRTLYVGNRLTLRENTFRQNLGLLTREGSYNLMASLLSDVNSFSMKVAVFRGTDKTDLIRRNEYGYKCMLAAARQVLDYMESLNETQVDVSGGLRREQTLFDFPSFREAWLNACLHNRWSRLTPPAVYVFDDRIEVLSVGGLPEGLSLEEFYEGKSKPVNLELQQIMASLDFVEQTGHGVPLIVSHYGRGAFDITENYITVTIPLRKELKYRGTRNSMYHRRLERQLTTAEGGCFERDVKSAGTGAAAELREEEREYGASSEEDGGPAVTGSPDPKTVELLHLMRENDRITTKELSERLGLGTTAVTARIRKLREEGIIARAGSRKNGCWVVKCRREDGFHSV